MASPKTWQKPTGLRALTRPYKQFLPKKNLLPQPAKKAPIQGFGPSWLGLGLTLIPEGGPEAFYRANQGLFRTGTTSRDEAYFYWALQRILGPEGPEGGWYYQSGHNDPNSAVVDFRINRDFSTDLAIRIQTSYFHLDASAFKQATDREQVYALIDRRFEVVDVWSGTYINDPSGKAVLAIAREALAGQERLTPIIGG